MAAKLSFIHETPEVLDYAEFVDEYSDKFYEIRVDERGGKWYVTRRWGRRSVAPDLTGGQSAQEEFTTRHAAVQAASQRLSEKQRKGYELATWPCGPVPVPVHDREALEQWLQS